MDKYMQCIVQFVAQQHWKTMDLEGICKRNCLKYRVPSMGYILPGNPPCQVIKSGLLTPHALKETQFGALLGLADGESSAQDYSLGGNWHRVEKMGCSWS